MSDYNNNEGKQQPPRLTLPQQDRAAGLLVGMAVGESMESAPQDGQGSHRYAGEMSDRALIAVEEDQPEPFESQEYIEFLTSDVRLALAYATGSVLRCLHLTSAEVFQSAYACAVSDANEMWFPQPRILGETCALWAVMLHHAVLTGEADLRVGLSHLNGTRSEWVKRIQDIEGGPDPDLDWAGPYELLHAAWVGALNAVSAKRPHGFATGMQNACSPEGGWLVGSLVGAALGAFHGHSGIPWLWRRSLRDTRGNSMDHLMRSAVSAALDLEYLPDRWPEFQRVEPQEIASPTAIVHPSDPGVLLGGVGALGESRAEATVSLCYAGAKLRPPRGSSVDHAVFWLADSDDPSDNPNLDFVLEDAARTVLTLRREGKTVLLHGLTGESRTPAVAARYGALISGRPVWEEFQRITRAMPQTAPNAGFLRHLASSDTRPVEVTEERTPELVPSERLTVDRQLIELLSWTIAAELLKKDHTDGWVAPMDGPEDGFAVLLTNARIEFLRAGRGITLNGEPFMTWPQVVAVGNPRLVIARLEAELGLLFKGCVVLLTSVSTWKSEFAAGLVRAAYGRAATVRVQPLAESPEQRSEWGGMSGPPLLCTVGDESFVLERDDWIATGMLPLWHGSDDGESPETAASKVLDRLLLDTRNRSDE